MNLLTEMPEEKYNNFMCGDSLDDEDYDEIVEFMAQGTLIPDNATNLDVLMAVFPNEIDFRNDFDEDWWYAPFKKGDADVGK